MNRRKAHGKAKRSRAEVIQALLKMREAKAAEAEAQPDTAAGEPTQGGHRLAYDQATAQDLMRKYEQHRAEGLEARDAAAKAGFPYGSFTTVKLRAQGVDPKEVYKPKARLPRAQHGGSRTASAPQLRTVPLHRPAPRTHEEDDFPTRAEVQKALFFLKEGIEKLESLLKKGVL